MLARNDDLPAVSVVFLRKMFGVSQSTIENWISQGMVIRSSRGLYDLAKTVQTVIDEIKGKRDNRKGTFAEARAKQMSAQTALAELKLAEANGEVMKLADVEAALLPRVDACNKKIWGIGPKLALQLSQTKDPAVCQRLLEEQFKEAFEEVSDLHAILFDQAQTVDGETAAGDEDTSDAVSSSAASDDKPMGRSTKKTKPRVKRRTGKVANRKSPVHARSNGRRKR